MKPRSDFDAFADEFIAIAKTLTPVQKGDPGYLDRYILYENETGNLYVNHFMRDDADQELHSHPWHASSLILRGGYREEQRVPFAVDALQGSSARYHVVSRDFIPGDVNALTPDTFHRVELFGHDCWTLFQTGPRVQEWSFWCRKTGIETPWREFTEGRSSSDKALDEAIARGSAEMLEAERLSVSPVLSGTRYR